MIAPKPSICAMPYGSRGWRMVAVVIAVGCLAVAPANALGGAAGELGRVDTVAGPGFCQSPAAASDSASTVRALAVSPSGTLFVDVGPLSEGWVATVREGAPLTAMEARVPVKALRSDEVLHLGEVQAASRLAPAGALGAVAAVGDRVVQVAGGVPVAGVGATPGQPRISSGDGGPALAATFQTVLSIAGDSDGNLLIADAVDPAQATFSVRFVNRGEGPVVLYGGTPHEVVVPPGAIQTIAGAQGPGAADEGPAREVVLRGRPPAMASAGGILYLATYQLPGPNQGVRSIVSAVNLGTASLRVHGVDLAPGTLRTVAGGPPGFAGDGGPALAAQFGRIPGIAATADGLLYLADEDNHRIRLVDGDGGVRTFAGAGTTGLGGGGYDGNGRVATDSLLNRPFDVKVGADERVYISDSRNGQVRYVDPDGIIHGLPSGLGPIATCETGSPVPSTMAYVAADASGATYLTAEALSQVKRIEPDGAVVNVVGIPEPTARGSCPPWPPGCPTVDNRPGPETALDRPAALATGLGGIYVYEAGHRAVRFLNTAERPVVVHGITVKPGRLRAVVAGNQDSMVEGLPGPNGVLSERALISADRVGNLFLADPARNMVWVTDRRGHTREVVVTEAGSSCCGDIRAISATSEGNLYILDRASNRVWFRNLGPSPVEALGTMVPAGQLLPVVGRGGFGVGGEGGPALEAEMLNVVTIVAGPGDDLFMGDIEEMTVRRISSEGIVTTIAGMGSTFGSFNGDGRLGPLTQLQEPVGLAIDTCGRLLILDRGNDRVRRLNLAPACIPDGELGGFSPAARSSWTFVIPLLLSAIAMLVWLRRRRRRSNRASPVTSDRPSW